MLASLVTALKHGVLVCNISVKEGLVVVLDCEPEVLVLCLEVSFTSIAKMSQRA